jgi:hypothetical protein
MIIQKVIHRSIEHVGWSKSILQDILGPLDFYFQRQSHSNNNNNESNDYYNEHHEIVSQMISSHQIFFRS